MATPTMRRPSRQLPEHGVSAASHAEDDPARVVVNRTRLCEAVDADPDGATMAWQRHGGTVTRAQPRGIITPGTVYDHCDGLWSDAPGRAMLLLTADCMPIAIARSNGLRPAVEILHAGWRGLLAGIVAAGVRAIGAPKLAAVIGPSIGPCCYEVDAPVIERFEATFPGAWEQWVTPKGPGKWMLDLWRANLDQLTVAGIRPERADLLRLCTGCRPDLLFSYRREKGAGRLVTVAALPERAC